MTNDALGCVWHFHNSPTESNHRKSSGTIYTKFSEFLSCNMQKAASGTSTFPLQHNKAQKKLPVYFKPSSANRYGATSRKLCQASLHFSCSNHPHKFDMHHRTVAIVLHIGIGRFDYLGTSTSCTLFIGPEGDPAPPLAGAYSMQDGRTGVEASGTEPSPGKCVSNVMGQDRADTSKWHCLNFWHVHIICKMERKGQDPPEGVQIKSPKRTLARSHVEQSSVQK